MKDQPIERRRLGRRGVCKPATITLPSGASLRATVVNLSEGGALIAGLDGVVDADRLELIIPADDIRIACRVAHQTAGKIGVEFIALPVRASYRSRFAASVASVEKIKQALCKE